MESEVQWIWRRALQHGAASGHESYLHGPAHWCRVERNGLWLWRQYFSGPCDNADPSAADTQSLVRMFAACHDCARRDDGPDAQHGPRAAELLLAWKPKIAAVALDQLHLAVRIHTTAQPPRELPISVQICLDADRLDIGRVGYPPHPDYLFTPFARDLAVRGAVRELDRESFPVTCPDLLQPTPWP